MDITVNPEILRELKTIQKENGKNTQMTDRDFVKYYTDLLKKRSVYLDKKNPERGVLEQKLRMISESIPCAWSPEVTKRYRDMLRKIEGRDEYKDINSEEQIKEELNRVEYEDGVDDMETHDDGKAASVENLITEEMFGEGMVVEDLERQYYNPTLDGLDEVEYVDETMTEEGGKLIEIKWFDFLKNYKNDNPRYQGDI